MKTILFVLKLKSNEKKKLKILLYFKYIKQRLLKEKFLTNEKSRDTRPPVTSESTFDL